MKLNYFKFYDRLILQEKLFLLGLVCKSRIGSSGGGSLAILDARTFSNSKAAFLKKKNHVLSIGTGIQIFFSRFQTKITDEEDEDFVHFHSASCLHVIYPKPVVHVQLLDFHFPTFSLTTDAHNPATKRMYLTCCDGH